VVQRVRTRFWLEAGLSAFSAVLFALTFVWHDWIEMVFSVDPDHSSGSLEWVIVACTFFLTVACALGARHEWRATARQFPS
jgi:hypothetical protein